jgi:transcriptional regulator with XRE-family HTH domain
MDSRSEISSFLASRRAKLTPEQAGVPLYSGARRVPGLRREEVAHLAGVSVDYYARLERGKISGASREVMEAIARALQLDEDERDHLLDLARITQRRARRRKPSNRSTVRPGIQSVLDSIDAPAFVQNARLDRLASNRIGRALYSLPDDGSGDRFNYAHYLFLDSRAPRFHRDFTTAKHNVVALLHAATARDPYDRELIEIIGTLSAPKRGVPLALGLPRCIPVPVRPEDAHPFGRRRPRIRLRVLRALHRPRPGDAGVHRGTRIRHGGRHADPGQLDRPGPPVLTLRP